MNAPCPRCASPASPGDRFCATCGEPLGTSPLDSPEASAPDTTPARPVTPGPDLVHPLPRSNAGTPPEPVTRRTRKRTKRRHPWYRRGWVIALLALVLVLSGAALGAWSYIDARFAQINEISTPAPEVPSDVLGSADGTAIDTGPAQEAIRQAEQRASNDAAPDTPTTMPSSADVVPGSPAASSPTAGESSAGTTRTGGVPTETVSAPTESAAGTAESPAGTAESTGERTPSEVSVPADSSPPSSGTEVDPAPTPAPVPLQASAPDTMTVLLMGVDARDGEPIDINVRPDTLALLHLDGATGSCRMLSIPRDTRTELPGYGQSKVNHALAVGGIPYQVLVTEQLLGVEIDHYGLIDMGGITDLVDAVGGVTVTNDVAFEHLGYTFDVGQITLDGEEALAYARFRYDAGGDFSRIDRQQDIVRALISQTDGMDVVSGARDLLTAVDGHVKTDLEATELIGLAGDYRDTCTEATLETATLDGGVGTYPDALLEMDLSFVVVEPAEIDRQVSWLLGRAP